MGGCSDRAMMENKLREYGLVNIKEIDSSIGVELKYSTTDNFTGGDMYGQLVDAYLLPEIAQMLASASAELHRVHPGYNLLVYDAARPVSIQRYMFEFVRGTDKQKYVADPSVGGYHNYGLAVDLTITDEHGQPLDMGSPFDCFEAIANVGNEDYFVENGLMTSEARDNRLLLKTIMEQAGFDQNPDEWWHFQKYSLEQMKSRFRLLDF